MKKDKLTRKDLSFFIIPFLILTLGVGTLTYYTAQERVSDVYHMMEKSSLNIASSYTAALLNYQDAYEIAVNLLEDKILVASRAVLLIDNNDSTTESLKNLAQELQVEWKTFEGHPAFYFKNSKLESFMEESRPDTVSGEYYKFGYVRKDDSTFVQIGVLDENLNAFTQQFELQNLIEDIVEKQDVDHALFISNEYKVLASSMSDYRGNEIMDDTVRRYIDERKLMLNHSDYEGEKIIHVSAPVFSEEEYLGTLLLIWPGDLVDEEIRSIMIEGFIEFLILMCVGGAILYYAYRKDKSNIRIAYYDELTGIAPESPYRACPASAVG